MLNFLKTRQRQHFKIKKATQITDVHCGPAVIQMLLSNLDKDFTQEEITKAAGITRTIKRDGSRPDQLAQAVQKLAPDAQLWFKFNSTFDDLRVLLNEYKLPVAVEWQGVFGQKKNGQLDTDGHYSLVTKIDEEKRQIVMVDPYVDYTVHDRLISINAFTRLWWDTNNYVNKKTNRVKVVKDTRLLFFVAPKETEFIKKYGFKKAEQLKTK